MLENLDMKLTIPPEQMGNVIINLQVKMLGTLLVVSQQLTRLISLNPQLPAENVARTNELGAMYGKNMQTLANELDATIRAKFGQ